MINIHNNISDRIEDRPCPMRPNPNCNHRATVRWPNKFQAMFEYSCYKFFNDHKWRHWDPKRPNIFRKLVNSYEVERLQIESRNNIQNCDSV